MHAVGITLILIGAGAAFVGWFWLVVLIFRESRLMGYATLFVLPALAFAAVFFDWDSARRPFFLWLAGAAVTTAGIFLMR